MPGECVLKFDVKYLPVEMDRDGRGQPNNADMVKADVVNWIRTLCEGDPWLADHQPELIWYQHCIPHYLEPSHPLVGLMSGAAQNVMGWSMVSGFPAGCDARHLQNRAGVPAVIFGPATCSMHTVSTSACRCRNTWTPSRSWHWRSTIGRRTTADDADGRTQEISVLSVSPWFDSTCGSGVTS